jgi:Fe-S cluster assembly protein SufD
MCADSTTTSFRGTGDLERYIASLNEPSWVQKLRREALRRFHELEWPARRDEEWRRTDISMYDFEGYSYEPVFERVRPSGRAPVEELSEEDSPIVARIHAKNGRVESAELSSRFRDSNAALYSLRDVRHDSAFGTDLVQTLLGRAIQKADNKIQLWHYVTFPDAVVLHVPKAQAVEGIVHIRETVSGEQGYVSPQVFVSVAEEASVQVVYEIDSEEDAEVLVNGATDISLGSSARLSFSFLQNLNIDCTVFHNDQALVSRDASLRHFVSCLGGLLAKQRFECELNGSGADVDIDGIYFPFEDQHMDLRTVQHHVAPNSNSRTYYKGVVKDEARSVYQGLISVDHGAPQTDAYLTNKNLVLNDGARADSIPSLRIDTDDVKCSHGSTTGKIDQNVVYYLQSRGYAEADAKMLIVEGFLADLVDGQPDVLKSRLSALIEDRIRSEE